MAADKRQRRGKPLKTEQRKARGSEWRPQVEHIVFLASPVYRGQDREEEKKTLKERSQHGAQGFSSCLLGQSAFTPRGCIFFACQIKLSCNTGPSVASNFCCSETEPRKLHTPLTYICIIDTDIHTQIIYVIYYILSICGLPFNFPKFFKKSKLFFFKRLQFVLPT